MIDFLARDSLVLLNPRLSEAQKDHLQNLVNRAHPPDNLVWIATSGSTDTPKLVGLTREALLASAQAVNAHLQSCPSDTWLLALPAFHVGGIGVFARAYLSSSKVVSPFAQAPWSPAVFAETAEKNNVTLSALVPTQLFDLVRANISCPRSIRAIVIGGGVLAPSLYTQAKNMGYPILPSYGLSECSSQVATANLESLSKKTFPRALNILDHVETRLSPDNKLQIKSAATLSCYLIERDDQPICWDPRIDGWFETQDKVLLANNYLTFESRLDQTIKISGENVNIGRLNLLLENLRQEHSLPNMIVLHPFLDERLEHLLTLVTEKNSNQKTLNTIVERFNKKVLPFERIQKTIQVDKIPTSLLGKPLINELENLR